MSSTRPWWYRLTHFDQGLAELRAATAAMVAVLLSYGSALILEHAAHLHVDVVIQVVVLALTLARAQRRADPGNRMASFVVLPVAAMAANGVGLLISRRPTAGDALFVTAVCLSIWIRRFGPVATGAGTLAVLPFVSILVIQAPVPPSYGGSHALWVALAALIAAFWVFTIQAFAGRAGFSERAWSRHRTERGATVTRNPGGSRRSRMLASTRMAVQMGVALGGAFAVGRIAFPTHWTWAVLTAFIVCSGARGRGDVGHKGVLRGIGAALGTVVATEIAGAFGPRESASIVLIFAALTAATWLRSMSYAYWAGCVTAVLSLLYGYFGETAPALLRTRLEEIVIGAVLGITASWLVLPVRTADVVRRRVADALAALGDILGAERCEPAVLEQHQARFDQSVDRLDQIARPLEAHRVLVRHWRSSPHHADAIDAVRGCVKPVRSIVRCAAARCDVTKEPGISRLNAAVLANVVAVRRAIGRRPGAGYKRLPDIGEPTPGTGHDGVEGGEAVTRSQVAAAITQIDAEMSKLSVIFRPAPPERSRS
jgi:hypothetical protein